MSYTSRPMFEVVIFTGIQAAGKSSLFRERFFDTHVRINLDMLRTRHRERTLFEACLAGKASMVIDNTNLTRELRSRYIAPARQHGFRVIGYYFRSQVAESVARNAGRSEQQQVPERAITRAASSLEIPSLSEGFDELFYVRLGDGFVIEPWNEDAL